MDALAGSPTRLGFFDARQSARNTFTSDGVADTEFIVTHNLGRKPTGFIVVDQDAAGTLYRSATDWTKTDAYFKSDGVSVSFTVIFI